MYIIDKKENEIHDFSSLFNFYFFFHTFYWLYILHNKYFI